MTNTYKRKPFRSIIGSKIKYIKKTIRKDLKRYASHDYVPYKQDTDKVFPLDIWDSTVLWNNEYCFHYPSYSDRLYYISSDELCIYLRPTINRRHKSKWYIL